MFAYNGNFSVPARLQKLFLSFFFHTNTFKIKPFICKYITHQSVKLYNLIDKIHTKINQIYELTSEIFRFIMCRMWLYKSYHGQKSTRHLLLILCLLAPVEDLRSCVLLVHPWHELWGPHPHLPPEPTLPRGEAGRGGVLEGGRKRVLHSLRGR